MHLRDRAQKHEHQAEAKKDFSAGFCLYINWLFHFVSSFSFLASLIWVLHRGTAENSARGYAQGLDLFFEETRLRSRGLPAFTPHRRSDKFGRMSSFAL